MYADDPSSAAALFNLHVRLDDGSEEDFLFDPWDVDSGADLAFVTNVVWEDAELVEIALDLIRGGRGGVRTEQPPGGDYFTEKGRFIPARLACDVELGTTVRMGHDRILWRRLGGAYLPDCDAYVRHHTRRLLGEGAKGYHVNEVVKHFNDREGLHTMPERPPFELVYTRQGAINWKTGATHPAGPEFASPVQLPVTYKPGADCPRLQSFLGQVLPDIDPAFVYELIGYCLLADNPLHKAFMFIGPGRNGKSTLLNVIRALLGSRNCAAVSLHDLEDIRFTSAQLFGKLANICGDIDARQLRTSSRFKQLTGGDEIFAEHKGKEGFSYTPFAKLIFSANEPPLARDQTHAYFSRLVIVPFERVIAEEEANRNLTRDLTSEDELSGLLNQALAGLARLMQRQHFEVPEPVRAAGERYRAAADGIAVFIGEKLCLDALASIDKASLYGQYQDWCRRGGNPPRDRTPFYDAIRNLAGVEETTRRFKGIGHAPLDSAEPVGTVATATHL